MSRYKYEDKVYFLDDVLHELKKDGFSDDEVRAMEQQYYYVRDSIFKDIKKTENSVYQLSSFGTLFYPLKDLIKFRDRLEGHQAHSEIRDNYSSVEQFDFELDLINKKLDRIYKTIREAKESGSKMKYHKKEKKAEYKILNNGKDTTK